jgi:hypothetical protein
MRVPLGTLFRYIGDTAAYIARYDDLFTGKDEKIDVSKVPVSMNGIELQDREFFAAMRQGRARNSSVAQVRPMLPGAGSVGEPTRLIATLVRGRARSGREERRGETHG